MFGINNAQKKNGRDGKRGRLVMHPTLLVKMRECGCWLACGMLILSFWFAMVCKWSLQRGIIAPLLPFLNFVQAAFCSVVVARCLLNTSRKRPSSRETYQVHEWDKNKVKKMVKKGRWQGLKKKKTIYTTKSGEEWIQFYRPDMYDHIHKKNIYIITNTLDWDNISTRKTKYKSELTNSQLVNSNSSIVRTNWRGTTTLHRGLCIKEQTNLHTNQCHHR